MSRPDDVVEVAATSETAGETVDLVSSMLTKDGHVIVESTVNGNWQADCTRCGAGCGAAGTAGDDDLDYEQRMLEDFTAEHRVCTAPVEAPGSPSPAAMPSTTRPKPTVWVVHQTCGGQIRVLAERHSTYARPDGTELRFHNDIDEEQHRVATVRAGAWDWVAAENALAPEAGEA